jgi:hypothetical protein
MSERHHHLRLWILGTLVMMVTMGSLTGSLLRQWSDGIDLPVALSSGNPLLAGTASLLVLILSGLWFRNGVRLWKAVRA